MVPASLDCPKITSIILTQLTKLKFKLEDLPFDKCFSIFMSKIILFYLGLYKKPTVLNLLETNIMLKKAFEFTD